MKNQKLTENDRAEIRELYRKGGVTHRQLAEQFGVTQGYVSQLTFGIPGTKDKRMALHLHGLCSWVERAVNAYDHNETDKLREALGRAYELVVRIRDENKE